jgi:hypothetical protein
MTEEIMDSDPKSLFTSYIIFDSGCEALVLMLMLMFILILILILTHSFQKDSNIIEMSRTDRAF